MAVICSSVKGLRLSSSSIIFLTLRLRIRRGVSLPEAPSTDASTPDVWSLRTAQWRLSYYPGQPLGELYDLGADPDEFVNLWGVSTLNATRNRLKEELLDRVLQARDPLPAREKPY